MAATTTTHSPAYSQDLAQLILARCEDPDYAASGRLPTERSLAAEFGVTRTMVRHALAVLEAEGRVSREVGRGTFLTAAALLGAGGPVSTFNEVGPADVMAARRLIEPQVLPLVVAYATQRDFDELRRCLLGGGAAQSAREFEAWDYALHHAIVEASRNQLLVSMYRMVERVRDGEIWGNMKSRNDTRERRDVYQADHVEIVEAICARELDRATAAMDAHLARVEANLLAGGGSSPSS
ncbi:MAG: FadR family transcriptional regulator [Acidobacteriota bacterium]|nr:FadR family transcriptional regulator [Acidobacteriota bacterium]